MTIALAVPLQALERFTSGTLSRHLQAQMCERLLCLYLSPVNQHLLSHGTPPARRKDCRDGILGERAADARDSDAWPHISFSRFLGRHASRF